MLIYTVGSLHREFAFFLVALVEKCVLNILKCFCYTELGDFAGGRFFFLFSLYTPPERSFLEIVWGKEQPLSLWEGTGRLLLD